MMFNQVALSGCLTRPASERMLPSGTRLVTLEVTVVREDGPAESTPVVFFDAPGWVATLDVGAEVVVVGRIRRRFFRAGGATQSRTEVVATRVVTTRPLRRARRVLAEAAAALESAAVALGEPTAAPG